MLWTISIEYDSVRLVFTDECPLACVRQLLLSAITHDHHDLVFNACFDLMERIQDDPQDEYRIIAGDMSDRWRLVLKPSAPAKSDVVTAGTEPATNG
jgi:hypothetical protein